MNFQIIYIQKLYFYYYFYQKHQLINCIKKIYREKLQEKTFEKI